MTFVDAVRDCLSKGGFAEKKDQVEKGGDFLVGYKHWLYQICSDFQIVRSLNGMLAIGSGASFALGALFAMSESVPTVFKIEKALDAAEHFSVGVRRPFVIVST